MKRFFILATIALFCSTGSINAQDFLIDNTYMTPWQPQVSSFYETTFTNGCKFSGMRITTNGRVDGYSGKYTLKDGSYYYGNFNANLAPTGSGWYVKDDVPYYNTYNNYGKCTSSTRVETYGQTWMITGYGRHQITFNISNYNAGNSYSSGSSSSSTSNSSSSSSYQQKTKHAKTCTKCVGRTTCTTCSGRGRYQPNINGAYKTCTICSGTGKCSLCNGTGKHGHTWY